MNSKEEIFNQAKKLHLAGNVNEAKNLYSKLVEKDKNNFLFQNLLGTALLQLKKYDEAIKHLDVSIKLNPNFAETYANKGIALAEQHQYREAITNYDKAINFKNNFYNAYLNKGIALKNIEKYEEAIKYFVLCIKINPTDSKIYNNLGNLFIKQKKFKKALEAYDKAISLQDRFAEAYGNRGEVNQQLHNYEQAIVDYEKAIKLNNNLDYVQGKLLHAKMFVNDWENFDEQIENLKTGIKNKKKIILPFPLLSLIDDPELHKIVAELHSNNILKNLPISDKNKNKNKDKNKDKDKIKIGYFSARLHDSPTLHLMLDVFKNHNKSEFEIYGFSYGGIDDEWTKKIKKYFSKFYDISKLSTKEILDTVHKNNLQIAVNLTGHTLNAKDDIFYYQMAPTQINYLGYPGTLGSKIYKYIIADKIILPKQFEKNYSEEVLYLPNCYQPNQANREVSQKKFQRQDFNLPKNDFVFGCFNNNYKITPIIFSCWMKILRESENSVLWLFLENNMGKKNLEKEAIKNGVNPKRIIFTGRIAGEDHLIRIGFIDLFLDTYPYNAHTTASEAIRMGVPVLTIMGQSFASRVASSLLKNVGLEELIVNNIDDYVKTALKIAGDRKKLQDLKNHLNKPDNTKKLFDSKNFTKDLEEIYKNVIKLNY